MSTNRKASRRNAVLASLVIGFDADCAAMFLYASALFFRDGNLVHGYLYTAVGLLAGYAAWLVCRRTRKTLRRLGRSELDHTAERRTTQ